MTIALDQFSAAAPDLRRQDHLVIGGLLLFFLALTAVRLWTGMALNPDEAEAYLYGNELHIGYPAEPPAYMWWQWVVFRVVGHSILGLSLAKNLLQFLNFVLLYRFIRLAYPAAPALAATLSPFLALPYAFFAQNALSHTHLALLPIILTLHVLWRLVRQPRPWLPFALGAIVGLGLLSKFNFVFALGGLWTAFAVVHHGRKGGLGLSALIRAVPVACTLAAPTTLWMVANKDTATFTTWKLKLGASLLGSAQSFLGGLVDYAMIPAPILALFVLGSLRHRGGTTADAGQRDMSRVLILGGLVALALYFLTAVGARIGDLRVHWLIPMAFPILPGIILTLWGRLPAPLGRAQLVASPLLAATLSLAALPFSYAHDPGARLDQIRALKAAVDEAAPGATTIYSDARWVLANLQLAGSTADMAFWMTREAGPCGGVLIVADKTGAVVHIAGLDGRTETPRTHVLETGPGALALQIMPYRATAECPGG